jgi:hypothetical protein
VVDDGIAMTVSTECVGQIHKNAFLQTSFKTTMMTHPMVQESKVKNAKSIQSASYAAQTHVCIVNSSLVAVTTVDFLVLFLIFFPGFLDVRLVALGESILVVVAGVLDVFAVGAGDGAAVTLWVLVCGFRYSVCRNYSRVIHRKHSRRLVVRISWGVTLLGVGVRWWVALVGVWVLGRVALLGVWVLRSVALLRRGVLRVRVCSRRRRGGRCCCGRSCGSGLVLVIGVICNCVLVSTV